MNDPTDCVCWRCGDFLTELTLPLLRLEECPACNAEIHVCKMCEFFDPSVAKSCREPVAAEVRDNRRASGAPFATSRISKQCGLRNSFYRFLKLSPESLRQVPLLKSSKSQSILALLVLVNVYTHVQIAYHAMVTSVNKICLQGILGIF